MRAGRKDETDSEEKNPACRQRAHRACAAHGCICGGRGDPLRRIHGQYGARRPAQLCGCGGDPPRRRGDPLLGGRRRPVRARPCAVLRKPRHGHPLCEDGARRGVPARRDGGARGRRAPQLPLLGAVRGDRLRPRRGCVHHTARRGVAEPRDSRRHGGARYGAGTGEEDPRLRGR